MRADFLVLINHWVANFFVVVDRVLFNPEQLTYVESLIFKVKPVRLQFQKV